MYGLDSIHGLLFRNHSSVLCSSLGGQGHHRLKVGWLHHNCTFVSRQVGEMAQQLKALAATPDHLGSIPRTHIGGRRELTPTRYLRTCHVYHDTQHTQNKISKCKSQNLKKKMVSPWRLRNQMDMKTVGTVVCFFFFYNIYNCHCENKLVSSQPLVLMLSLSM